MPINELTTTYLTGVVENIQTPNQFLTRLLYRRRQPVASETVRVETRTSTGRAIAPFVRKGSEGIMVPGRGTSGYMVEAPNIRIKRPFTPSEQLFNRRPGGMVFSPTQGDLAMSFRDQIADDMAILEEMVVNAEEWLVAMSLQGTITYAVTDEEVFTITFPKPNGNNTTLTVMWDDADPTDTRPFQDVVTIRKIFSDAGEAQPTDVILGSEATDAFLELVESGNIKLLQNGSNGVDTGAGISAFVNQFQDDGALFLGNFAGLRWWSYTRTATLNGVSVDLIRPKYAEFVSVSPASRRVMYYGAIPDVAALKGRSMVGRRFAKSWEVEDPSAMMSLLHSRPLPVPERPAATVSVQVVTT